MRNLDTTLGELENLKVPGDREGKFRTKLIEPYKKRDISLEDLILGMFASGMSARSVAQILESKVRAKDRKRVAKDLKKIYQALTEEETLKAFERFKEKWGSKYPKIVKSWKQELYKLLTFLKYPEPIRRVIYTTNLIERTIKEIRRRVKLIGDLPSVGSVEKFVCLRVAMLNDRWSNRVVNGFLEAKEEIQEVFLRRYS